MDEKTLNLILSKSVKKHFQKAIADAKCFIRGNLITVVIRLKFGMTYDDIEDFEEWMFNVVVEAILPEQKVEFYWQLTP